MSTRDTPPAPGFSPTGANEGLFGVLQAFIRSSQFVSVLADHGFVKHAPGDLKMTATVDPPPGGWLACDFTLYRISQYPALAAVLQKAGYEDTAYTGGTPAGMFYTPDFRGVPIMGADPNNANGGGNIPLNYWSNAAMTLSINNLPQHNHALPGAANFVATGVGPGGTANVTTGGGGYSLYNVTANAPVSAPTSFRDPRGAAVNVWIKT